MDFDQQTLANEDAALEIRTAGATTLTNRLLIHREKQFATNFFSTGIWGSETTPANLWSDYTLSTPLQDVTTASRVMQLKSGGFKPNTMVVGKAVRDILVNHPKVLARLNGGSTVQNPALVTDNKLAEIFGVENFLVMEAVENTAAEGLTESNAFIGGKHALLVHGPRAAGLMTPAAGITFAWNSLEGTNNLGITVESFSDDALKRQQIAEHIQVKMAYDMQVTGADLGYFFLSVVA
jgi:hypothetical protein